MHQVGVYPEVDSFVKVANISRLVQYFAKLIVYFLMVYEAREEFDIFGAIILALIFFVGYQFWRLIPLYKRIGKYVLQWPLPICDIAITLLVKIIYITTFESHDDSTYTYFIPFFLLLYAYLFYLLLVLVLFVSWLVACQLTQRNSSQQNQSNNFQPMPQNRVTTSSLAKTNSCYRFMLYFNYVFILFLVGGYIFALYFYYSGWPYPDTLTLLKTSMWLEGGDFLLNILQDLVISYYYNITPNSYLLSEPALPAIGCFSYSGPQSDEVVIQLESERIH